MRTYQRRHDHTTSENTSREPIICKSKATAKSREAVRLGHTGSVSERVLLESVEACLTRPLYLEEQLSKPGQLLLRSFNGGRGRLHIAMKF